MSDTLVLSGDVTTFVAQVRHHLRDLPAEERDELTEGLEADLAERVAEPGGADLGDPVAYAAELRAAAGLERTRWAGRASTTSPDALLDRCHAWWDGVVATVPGDLAGLLGALRPVWWVARAWVAVELVDLVFGSGYHGWLPSMFGPLGWALTIVAVVLSIQLGRGVLPLGPVSGSVRRIVLLGLNGFAALLLLPVMAALPHGDDGGGVGAVVTPHLGFNGNQVENVYAYDANGQPLTGVQLVDQNGRRLSIAGSQCQAFWTNGTKDVYSAFPVPTRTYDEDTGRCTGPATMTFPLASLPPVSLPTSAAPTP